MHKNEITDKLQEQEGYNYQSDPWRLRHVVDEQNAAIDKTETDQVEKNPEFVDIDSCNSDNNKHDQKITNHKQRIHFCLIMNRQVYKTD